MEGCPPEIIREGTGILNKLRDRAYTEYDLFRVDLTAYLDRLNERNVRLDNASAAKQTWREAALWLEEDYWSGFLFHPDSELAEYRCS